MTNLTEQWKKGELPDGYYYCKTENGVEILRTWRGIDGYLNFENMCNEVFISSMDDCKVLAEVPSFEEWQEYKDANDSMFDTIKMLNKDNYKLENENTELKELLKEVLRHDLSLKEVSELTRKIGEALGEE